MPRGVYERTEAIRKSISEAKKNRSLNTGFCAVPGCNNRSPQRTNICEVHYYRMRRTGSYDEVLPVRLDAPSYRAAHSRVDRDRGSARDHLCTDCPNPALHWSFAWRRVPRNEWLWSADGARPYTGNSGDYEARCVRCAIRYDRGDVYGTPT